MTVQLRTCASPKFNLHSDYAASSLIQPIYVPYAETVHGYGYPQFVFPPGIAAGNFGFATTACDLEGTALPAKAHYSGQSLLGDAATILVGVEAHACDRPARDSRRLASGRFQTVLDMALTA